MENFSHFGKNVKLLIFRNTFQHTEMFWANVHITSCAARAFICGSTDAISMHIGADIQKIRHNVLHHPTEKGPKMNGFWAILWQ